MNRLGELGHAPYAPPLSELDVTQDVAIYGRFMEILLEVQPDAVVYCVGANRLDWSYTINRPDFAKLMETNVWGFINTIKALQWRPKPYSVLALTSDAAVRPMRTSMAYCASKAALDMAIRVASRELSPAGWRINGLAPGKVAGTAMTRYVDERVLQIRGWTPEYAEEYELKSSPIGRPVTVDEIASVACEVLLSPVLAWTGDIVTVNGGR